MMRSTIANRGVGLRPLSLAALLLSAMGCRAEQAPPPEYPAMEPETAAESGSAEAETPPEPETPREPPPESGEPRDISFPEIERFALSSGLEVNTVEVDQLPVVYLQLVIRSGAEADPDDIPGLANFLAQMLKEGTARRSSAELAEDVEFLGADIWTDADTENITIGFRALAEHLDDALAIMAEVATQPAFSEEEITTLKARELDRLRLSAQDPRYLGRRAYYDALYGDHPYARFDTTPEAVNAITQERLVEWHRTHFVANNAYLVVAGDVDPRQVRRHAQRAFRRMRRGTVPEVTYAEPPERTEREVIIVDRPGSAQTQIRIGNLSMRRADENWIPMQVANQVLGGSASSRLFMDLRERRSLTYGAYSDVIPREQIGPFTAVAAVRTEVTAEAMAAFMEHLVRIATEPASATEVELARRYLSDSFPLRIDTPGKIASLVSDLRGYGLPDDYWESFRTRIRSVSVEDALEAARANVHPERAIVVLVGEASAFEDAMRRYGTVTVVDTAGQVLRTLPAQ